MTLTCASLPPFDDLLLYCLLLLGPRLPLYVWPFFSNLCFVLFVFVLVLVSVFLIVSVVCVIYIYIYIFFYTHIHLSDIFIGLSNTAITAISKQHQTDKQLLPPEIHRFEASK